MSDDLLHRHLNGDLDPAEQAAFLERLKDSPELRRALAARAIDETLLSDLVREGRVRAPARSRFSWPAVAAAALMLAGLTFILFPRTPQPVAPVEPAHPPVSSEGDKRIPEAITRGCRFLESRKADLFIALESEKRHDPAARRTYAELAALAFVRAGYAESHPLVDELVGRALGRPLDSTYIASLRATLLSEIGPRPDRIRACAQFLVDSQCPNGQWDYGRAVPVDDVPVEGVIRRRRDGPPSGDNSTTAFAVQGLLACARAGMSVEQDVLVRARRWWVSCQNPDGGWGYSEFGKIDQAGGGKLQDTSNSSYGSGTASGVASLAALRSMLDPDPAADAALERGLAWLGANFATGINPKKAAGFSHVHWLAAAGRAGILLGAGRFGAHDWYAEGSGFLLAQQKPTGEWRIEEGDFMKVEKNDVLDTCLAILFLTRKG
jgi:hypothetical protein